jgi:hypothetical protein
VPELFLAHALVEDNGKSREVSFAAGDNYSIFNNKSAMSLNSYLEYLCNTTYIHPKVLQGKDMPGSGFAPDIS